ncbi:hypothetical protein [Phytoactinopolyspora mesophila]|uniref:Uncharacterized protein n=1 Tax=Phytoactinopolyspora mesophila TaxID=2650750 RepID=A0A7K3M654_9ACTN|nr:hypothetical protein [Phytoactinopolyspora mesophila]NDL57918.1 hypothetical protein [Phytoactinopolyspora mesophila]
MTMPHPEMEWPLLDEATARARSDELAELAAGYGITNLRFASPGRLLGHVAPDRDLMDVAAFELAAVELLRAEVRLYSDGVLAKPHVSPDLLSARPL